MKTALTMKIKSSAFENNQPIPSKYTGDGADVSPPLTIDQLPEKTVTLAIIMDDPDAPSGTFDHWIAWNIPPTKSLAEGVRVAKQGKNGFGAIKYRGPYPPKGKLHHYHFKVYALDVSLNLPEGINKRQLEMAMDGHILAQGELIGTYQH